MKLLILLTVAAAARAQYYVPQDTPEVAAAKAAHLAELAKAALAAGVLYYPRGYLSIGTPVVTPDGFIADTPEVAAAKAAHFALKKYAASASVPAYLDPVYKYATSFSRTSADAVPVPVFSAAPAPAYSAAPAPPFSAAPAPAFSAAPAPAFSAASAPAFAPYFSPVVVKPDGFLADTPEVFAAKVNHFHAHIDRLSRIS